MGVINWAVSINQSHEKEENASLKSLFEGKNSYLTPILWYNWFSLCFMYYGILVLLPYMLSELKGVASIFGDNDLLKLFISALSEIVGAGIAAILIDLKGFGRKNSIVYFCACIGTTAFLAFYDVTSHFLFWTLLCKFFITMAMIFAYQLTTEMYDTKIRTTGIGTGIAVGRVGGILMPWVSLGLMNINLLLPFLLFSFLGFSVTFLDCYLEETLGKDTD